MDIWTRLLSTTDRLKRRLLFVGWLTAKPETLRVRPIVVGGHALEVYTLGDYATGDIDLVAVDRLAVGRTLSAAGFLREGRHWYRPDVDIVVKVPDDTLAGSPERLTCIAVDEFRIYVIGKEDLIIDRLNACVHWHSSQDCAWAK